MDIRQYDIYIDGVCLPRWFLTDADTQLGVRTEFRFDGYVRRMQADGSSPASPTYSDGFMPDHLDSFAELHGRILSFKLRQSVEEGHGIVVRLGSRATNTNMHWRVEGGSHVVNEFGGNGVWELDWGETYVIYVDYHGARTFIQLEVRRCRIALRDRSHELLNRVLTLDLG